MSNYGFDERDTTTAVTREAMHQPQYPQYQQPPAPTPYGYGQHWGGPSPYGYGFRNRWSATETKPFFLTSEFVVSLLSAIAIALSAATMHAFGGWRGWILITAIVCSYNLSRGIAKSGTRSRAHDPREDMNLHLGRGHDRDHDHAAARDGA